MKKQSTQIFFLLGLLLVWAGVAWRLKMIGKSSSAPAEIKAKAARAAQQDNLLTARFHHVRGEMDALYHYRIKPMPFDTGPNPFRIPAGIGFFEGQKPTTSEAPKAGDRAPKPSEPLDYGESLLKHAIALARIGGVVTLNGTTQVNIDGQLHREGDVFTVKLQNRLVLIRVKRLTESFAVLSLDDPSSGSAEARVRLQ
jgi:hypothetical protein